MTLALPISILHTLGFFLSGMGLLAVFLFVYTAITPQNEFSLIRQYRYVGPAITLSGAMIGFALPIGSVMLHGVDFTEFLLWSLIAGVIQIVCFGLFYVATASSHLWDDMMLNRNNAACTFYAAMSIVVGGMLGISLVP